MTSIKILIPYHKPYKMFKDDIFEPIHAGRDIAFHSSKDGFLSLKDKDWLFDNMIGDNTGDNISYKNREYCELTVQYWAWKNYDKLNNPDYIGFMHYRRHFQFTKHQGLFLSIPFHHRKKIILDKLDSAGIIMPEYTDISCNIYNQYKFAENFLHIEDYEKTIETVKRMYPEYAYACDTYNSLYAGFFCNMFIMKKDEFFSYSSWLFSILNEVEKVIDISEYDVDERRVFGHLAERLLGIYVLHNLRLKGKPIKTIKVCDWFSNEFLKDFNILNVISKIPLLWELTRL